MDYLSKMDKTRLNDVPPTSYFGHPNNVTFPPGEYVDDEARLLEPGRKFSGHRSLHIIKPFKTVVSRPPLDEFQDEAIGREAKREQLRWLQNTHPEASSSALPMARDLLAEEIASSNPADSRQRSSYRPLITYGEINNARRLDALKGAPALAMSCGESGQILRILRLTDERVGFRQRDNAPLRSWKMTPSGTEDEVFWSRSATPIRRIKFATDLNGMLPARWLIVQKESSTTILKPAYHRVPVAVDGAALPDRSTSRISISQICSITAVMTGGPAHVDVSFNPRSHGRPSQVAIIDAQGCWSVWDIFGKSSAVNHGFEATRCLCGNFDQGLPATLTELPRQGEDSFGLLFCPQQERFPGDWNDKMDRPDNVNTPENDIPNEIRSVPRAHALVLWNRIEMHLVNAVDGSEIRTSSIGVDRRTNPELLLSVQLNPADPAKILALTTESLYCIDFFPDREQSGASPRLCPQRFQHHFPHDKTISLEATYEAELGSYTGLAIIHSKESDRVDVFWLYGVSDSSVSRIPQFYHEIHQLDRPVCDEGSDPWHSLAIIPLQLRPRTQGNNGQRPEYHDLEVPLETQFYQILAFGRRLSLAHSLCATVLRNNDNSFPVVGGMANIRDSRENQKKHRAAFLRYTAEKFVLPDQWPDLSTLVQVGVEVTGAGPLEFKPLPSFKPRPRLVRRLACRNRDKLGAKRGRGFLEATEDEQQALRGSASTEGIAAEKGKLPEPDSLFDEADEAGRMPQIAFSRWEKALDADYITLMAQKEVDRHSAIMAIKARREERKKRQDDEYRELTSSQPQWPSIPDRTRAGPSSSQPFFSSQVTFGSSQRPPAKKRRFGLV